MTHHSLITGWALGAVLAGYFTMVSAILGALSALWGRSQVARRWLTATLVGVWATGYLVFLWAMSL